MPSKPPLPGGRVTSLPAASRSSASSSDDSGVHFVKIDASRQLDEEFQFGETLGEGAFGHVLLAVRKKDDAKFAVKKLAKNKDTKSTYGKSWENEIRVLRRFQHPNIVQLEVIYESEDNCFLFMELCDAGTLGDELDRRGRFLETDAKCLLRQVGSALSFLHKNRVVHRDLKLQNCLLRTNGSCGVGGTASLGRKQPQQRRPSNRRSGGGGGGSDGLSDACPFVVKLTDFGLSIELRDIEHALVDNVGTPVYQAPEIVSGNSYTFKCDVWAFGILAYTMLHGQSPYRACCRGSGGGGGDSAASGGDLAEAIMSFEYTAACSGCRVCAGLSRECRDGLQRLLLSGQVERWSMAEFMQSAWATDTASADAEGGSILELMRSMNKANVRQ